MKHAHLKFLQRWKKLVVLAGLQQFSKTYLFEENPQRSLNPLFSAGMATIVSNSIWVFTILLLVFWPQRELPTYLIKIDIPLSFLVICEVLLLGKGYFNLAFGAGDMLADEAKYYFEPVHTTTYEELRPFLSYGLPKFVLQIVLFFIPFLPFVFISALISQVSWRGVFQCLGVIFSFSLFCRLLGFAAYLKWQKALRSHYLTRSLLIVFWVATLYYLPWINPIFVVYHLYLDAHSLGTTSVKAHTIYWSFMGMGTMLFIVINHVLVQQNLSQKAR